MNKKEQLLTETFSDDSGDHFARAAAACARRRRRAKHLLSATALALTAIAVMVITHQPAPEPFEARPAPSSNVEIISDHELTLQLKDQSVLLVKDHAKISQVVFLSGKDNPSLANTQW